MTQSAPSTTRKFDPRWLPLVVTTIGSFMSILDSNVVNIALPSILHDFNTSLSSGQLVIASYVMALAVVVPLCGFLAERIGKKRLYIFTLICFISGSALCGLAWNIETLVLFRVLQGLGGGILQPLSMALVFTMITPLERPKFIALLGIPVLIAPIFGPSIGGYITEYLSWRWVFYMNVPVGLVNILMAIWLLKETQAHTETRMDFRGFILAALAFPSILLGLSQGSELGWTSPAVLLLLIGGGAFLTAFIWVELNHADPMLRLHLLAIPMFRRSLAIQLIAQFSLFGLNFILPLFLQRAHGMGAAEAGKVLLPMGIVAFVTMNLAGRLYYKIGPKPLVLSGLAMLALTTLVWAETTSGTPTWMLMLLACGRGLALGLATQIVQVVAFNSIPEGEMTRATSLVNVCQRINQAFASAVLTTVLIVALAAAGAPAGTSISSGDAPLPDMMTAFRAAFLLMTVMSLVGLGLALSLRDRVLEAHTRRTAEEGADEKIASTVMQE